MRKPKSSVISTALFLNETDFSKVLWRRLYFGIRTSILNRKLPCGTFLPSTRQLADELGISRNTVTSAYEQLKSEGYLESSPGSGTFVSVPISEFPEKKPPRGNENTTGGGERRKSPKISKRAQEIENLAVTLNRYEVSPRPFQHNLPALDAFPFAVWKKLVTRKINNGSFKLFLYGDPAGYRPLREALGRYLTSSRGVLCTPEEIIITNGTQQSLDLVNKVILDAGDKVIFEDPGHPGAKSAFLANGVKPVPAALDEAGLRIDGFKNLDEKIKALYVTPSHQYPAGITMTMERRFEILHFARQKNLWIIEDDESSEYRYKDAPLPALQGLQFPERVIYVGSFSKKLFPGLRLGYIVVPNHLKNVFTQAKTAVDRQSPQFEQSVLADFIAEGHFNRHIKRMRKLYYERQQIMLEELSGKLPPRFEITGAEAGMHLVIKFPADLPDKSVSARLREIGIEASALSDFCEASNEQGLLLGFAGFGEKVIREETAKIVKILKKAAGSNQVRTGSDRGRPV